MGPLTNNAMPPDPRSSSELKQSRWFTEEVQAHEPALRAYLRNRFPSVRDVDDVVQESYIRVWHERAKRPVEFGKAFLFKVARHLAIDVVRKKNRSPEEALPTCELDDLVQEGSSVADAVSDQEKVNLLAEAIDHLPHRCREVVVLRKLKLLSQKEVAAQLGLSEKTVEAQLARGVKRCEDYLRKRGVYHSYFDASL
ncbi:MAG TPA: RNA polymerase sigma factor [Opitutaceae bacterium]|nr:RNA polymerase sigma factor [Opitutaceae bacterium]